MCGNVLGCGTGEYLTAVLTGSLSERPCAGIEEFPELKRKVYVTGEQMPALARVAAREREKPHFRRA